MTRRVQRAVFLLLAAALLFIAARLPTSPQQETADIVYVYGGYAAAADAPWDEKSLALAAHRFEHLMETYFSGGGYRFYLSVVPDKAQFTQPPEGYTPAGASETADWLSARLPVQTVDVASLLTLESYYRTDPHWRQETLLPAAQKLAEAMGAALPEDREETLRTLNGEFHGSYWGKTTETLTPDTLAYLTDIVLEGCTVYDYETDATGIVYDFAAARTAPYDLFLGGSKSLLRVENPAAANDRTLIVFRDSFGSSLIPLLAEGYATVYAVDIRYLSGDLLGRFVDIPEEADVLFLYSTTVLHNSITLK